VPQLFDVERWCEVIPTSIRMDEVDFVIISIMRIKDL
jgi:hypothetical protein